MSDDNEVPIVLTKGQKARIEKNRQKAITLKQSKLIKNPIANNKSEKTENASIKIGNTKYKDTGGGFLLEEDNFHVSPELKQLEDEKGPILDESEWPTCEECNQTFISSYLFEKFDYCVCDSCRDQDKHNLITKTEAMKEYLLKECDLEKRTPPLKYITRKNPHNSNWGQMKLYLQIQVEKRALEVWGSEDALREQFEQRDEKRILAKTKKYHKEMKKLRMAVRSSLYDKTTASHKHSFGAEVYNEETDDYTRKCETCGFKETFEKM